MFRFSHHWRHCSFTSAGVAKSAIVGTSSSPLLQQRHLHHESPTAALATTSSLVHQQGLSVNGTIPRACISQYGIRNYTTPSNSPQTSNVTESSTAASHHHHHPIHITGTYLPYNPQAKSALYVNSIYTLPALWFLLRIILPDSYWMRASKVEKELKEILEKGGLQDVELPKETSTAAAVGVTPEDVVDQPMKDQTSSTTSSTTSTADSPSQVDQSPRTETPELPIDIDLVHRLRDGGLLMYFENSQLRDAAINILRNHYSVKSPRVSVFRVLGTPYVDDLILKGSSSKLKVEYETDSMNAEDHLFEAFRHYGRITNIQVDRKLKTAVISFMSSKHAIAAKNCLHGAKIHGTGRVVVRYESFSRFKWLAEMSKSPKLIPLFAILISIFLVLMVEPFRLLNVIQKLAVKSNGTSTKEQVLVRKQAEESLEDLFSQNAGCIFLISGNQGSGKSTMLQNIVNRRKYAALISCLKDNSKGRGNSSSTGKDETALIERLEEGLNFSPSFSKVNSVISYIEAFLPKSTNSMTSSNLQQLQNILKTLDNSLKILSSMYPSTPGKRYPYSLIVFDQFHELIKELEYANDGGKAQQLFDTIMDWANSVADKKTANVVFVCDNSLAIETFKKYKHMRSKCSTVHVLDLSADQSKEFLKIQLKKAPLVHKARPLESNDASNESISFIDILKYVWKQRISRMLLLDFRRKPEESASSMDGEDVDIPEEYLDQIIGILGGRLSDLTSLTERISRDFETVDSALQEMIKEAKTEILKVAFGPKYFVNETGRQWTQIQMWKTISAIAEQESIPYDTVLYKILDGDEKALSGLIHANLLGIEFRGEAANQYYITAFSPLYLKSFQLLTQDPFFARGMRKLMFDETVKGINAEIKGIEEEMHLLRTQTGGHGFRARMDYLNTKLEDATNRLIDTQEKYKREQV